MSNSKYADEGTVAHALAAMCLQEGKPAAAYIGRLIRCDDYEHASLSPSGAPRWMRCPGSHALETRIKFVPRAFSLQVTEDMAAAVQVYLDNLAKYTTARGIKPLVEHKLPIGHITGEEGATGSGDAVVLDEAAFEISVHDLKFGQGVEVFAEGNEQGALYLLGALEDFGEFCDWQRFRFVIHQPRIKAEPDEYVWHKAELLKFADQAREKAALATMLRKDMDGEAMVQEAEGIEAYLVPGEKQCKFCDAKAKCPAIAKTVHETVVAEFVDLDAPVKAEASSLVPIPAENARLARYLALVPLIESWCSHVAATAEAELLAGRPVPGFKLVTGKRGNRKWRDEAEAETTLKSMRLKHDQMYDYSVISPTSAEKLTKGENAPLGERQWKKLQALITQSDGKPSVVPESDKRPALEVKPVIEEFAALPAEVQPEELV